MKKKLTRLALGSALVLAFALTAPRVTFGDPGDRCHERLERDRARIDRDQERFGRDSERVRRDVDRMEDDRNWCRGHHQDWDHDRFDIGVYLRK
jgi:hypothetical protein